MEKIENIIKPFRKKDEFDIRPGDTVKVHQVIKEAAKKSKSSKKEEKERIQIFEGVVLARKHKREIGATITVRKVVAGVGVERVFPLHLPTIKKIKVLKRSKTRRAKLYYLRKAKGKRARLKRKEFSEVMEKENIPSPDKTAENVTEKKMEEKINAEDINPPAVKDGNNIGEKKSMPANPEPKPEATEKIPDSETE